MNEAHLCIICIPSAAENGNVPRSMFWTKDAHDLERLRDPEFRVSCRRCGRDHLLIDAATSNAEGGAPCIRPEFAILVAAGDPEGRPEGNLDVDALLPFRTGSLQREPERERLSGPSRNLPCPCGSGRKAKKCCGR